jgi:hypothetical protein
LRLSFAEVDDGGEVWEYAVLVTSLDNEILSIGQAYRDRADCENVFVLGDADRRARVFARRIGGLARQRG